MDLTPYIPQIITAVATLGGVVLTLIFTGRREAKRTEQQLAFEREKLLAEERRRLFVTTAHALRRTNRMLEGWSTADAADNRRIWRSAVRERTDELFVLETEIRLLAPSLTNAVRLATQSARSIRDAPETITEPEVDGLRAEYFRYMMSAMSQMRSLLGTKPADVATLTPDEQAHERELSE